MIELKGVITHLDKDHKYIDVIVVEGKNGPQKRHRVGVDIAPNRGKIITFLASMYSVRPGEIVWPSHIEL